MWLVAVWLALFVGGARLLALAMSVFYLVIVRVAWFLIPRAAAI